MAAQRSAPAPFLTKTYEMVEDVSTDEVISWNESGTTFVVWVPADFAKDLLPIYFKHNNFSSFVRQLNTYGFHKIAPERWEFANEFFRRGRRELLCEIRRRKNITASRVQNSSGEQSNAGEDLGSGDVDSKSYGSEETTIELSQENEKLRRDNQILSLEITRAKKQCEELIAFLSNHVKVEPDQTNDFVMQEQGWSSHAQLVNEDYVCGCVDDDDECTNNEEDCLKLFGVCLRRDKLKKMKKKREGDERAGDVVGGPLL